MKICLYSLKKEYQGIRKGKEEQFPSTACGDGGGNSGIDGSSIEEQ